jgi:flagellar basal-body rod modification protein FlgD
MSAIDPAALAAILGQKDTGTDSNKKSTELGQNQFLTLMLAQLKNQDPMKPTDPTQFLSQLAQFSQVTSTQNVEAKIGELTDSLRATQMLNGTSLVGHEILASTDTATFTTGTTLKGVVEVPEGAASAQVEVRDSAGQLIRRFAIQPTQGANDFSWDGYTSNGALADSDTYEIKVTASISGKTQSLDPMLYSRVGSVTIGSSGLILNTGVGAVDLDDVKRVM